MNTERARDWVFPIFTGLVVVFSAVMFFLALTTLLDIHSAVATLQTISSGRLHELYELQRLDNLIVNTLARSKHPSQVDQSILFQVCRAVGHCRIP